jgi:hypothetical protein
VSVNPDTRLERLYRIERLGVELANAAASMREERLDRDHALTPAELTELVDITFDVMNAVSSVKRAEATE